MQVGMTKDQGLYNNPSAAVHPGALAAGTLPQYNTITVVSDRMTSFSADFKKTGCFYRVFSEDLLFIIFEFFVRTRFPDVVYTIRLGVV